MIRSLLLFVLLAVLPGISFAQSTIESLYLDNLTTATAPSLSLSWSIPTQRVNGDPLPVTELKGYEIYAIYPDGTDEVIVIEGGSVTQHSISLSHGSGDYQFAIASIDTDSLKSAPSDTVIAGIGEYSPPQKLPGITVAVQCEAGAVCNFYLK